MDTEPRVFISYVRTDSEKLAAGVAQSLRVTPDNI